MLNENSGESSRKMTGTSFSSPTVGGLAALIMDYSERSGYFLAYDDIAWLFRLSANQIQVNPSNPLWNPDTGYGLLDAGAAFKLLDYPNQLRHWTTEGGTSTYTWDVPSFKFYVYPEGIPIEGRYSIRIHRVEKNNVPFPISFKEIPHVWGRTVGTKGYLYGEQFDLGWCQPDQVTRFGVSLHTFVFEVYRYASTASNRYQQQDFLGWAPCAPQDVEFAYTALGEFDSITDVEDTSDEPYIRVQQSDRGSHSVFFSISTSSEISISVYDVLGRHVESVLNKFMQPRTHEIEWDHTSKSGLQVASGFYLFRVQVGEQVRTAKALVLK